MSKTTKSVSKSVVSRLTVASFADNYLEIREKSDMALKIKSLQTANENLTGTMQGLNTRFVVQNDLQNDIVSHNNKFLQSEQRR